MRNKNFISFVCTLVVMSIFLFGWGVQPAQAASLTLDKSNYEIGEKIKVTFTPTTGLNNLAWIGIMPSGTPHNDHTAAHDADTSYFFVNNSPGGVGYLETDYIPAGSYDIRFFSDRDYKAAELASVTISVGSASESGPPGITLEKKSFTPGERIKVAFSPVKGYERLAWIGIMPSSTPHNDHTEAHDADTSYFFVNNSPSGVDYLETTGLAAGSYDIRFFSDRDYKAAELASVTITVGQTASTIITPPPVVLPPPVVTPSPNSVNVMINGKPLVSDVRPLVNEDGRTMLPVRAIAEALGAQVQWDGPTQTATLTQGTRTVKVTIGQNQINVNGSPVPMDTAAVVNEGRTLLPVRAVGEAFGAKIGWDAGTKTVNIAAPLTVFPFIDLQNSPWTGTWTTNWGKMVLTQSGNTVTGTYEYDSGRVNGTVVNGVLNGTWSESPSYSPPNDAGDIIFTLSSDGNSFSGQWRYGSQGSYSNWTGTRQPVVSESTERPAEKSTEHQDKENPEKNSRPDLGEASK